MQTQTVLTLTNHNSLLTLTIRRLFAVALAAAAPVYLLLTGTVFESANSFAVCSLHCVLAFELARLA